MEKDLVLARSIVHLIDNQLMPRTLQADNESDADIVSIESKGAGYTYDRLRTS